MSRKLKMMLALLLVGVLAVPPGAGALAAPLPPPVDAARSPGPTGAPSAATSPGWSSRPGRIPWVRVICGTAFVVGLICFGVFVLKKLNGGRPLTRGRYMELLEARPVGRKVQLFLVRVAGRVVLLASTGENVTRVAEFGEGELPQPDPSEQRSGLGAFKAVFTRLLGAHR